MSGKAQAAINIVHAAGRISGQAAASEPAMVPQAQTAPADHRMTGKLGQLHQYFSNALQ